MRKSRDEADIRSLEVANQLLNYKTKVSKACFNPVVPKLFFLVAPWLMVNPSRGPPALKQVTSSRIENIIQI